MRIIILARQLKTLFSEKRKPKACLVTTKPSPVSPSPFVFVFFFALKK